MGGNNWETPKLCFEEIFYEKDKEGRMTKKILCAVLPPILLSCLFLLSPAGADIAQAGNSTNAIVITNCLSNSDCEEGFFCAKPLAYCNGIGVCAERPDACITLYDPMCGCDGLTYGNACDAAMFGVSVAYRGVCLNCLICDFNSDNVCDISDVILYLHCLLRLVPFENCPDINDDGSVDISDVILTLRMALGLDPLKQCT
jgi:hypothetical protein